MEFLTIWYILARISKCYALYNMYRDIKNAEIAYSINLSTFYFNLKYDTFHKYSHKTLDAKIQGVNIIKSIHKYINPKHINCKRKTGKIPQPEEVKSSLLLLIVEFALTLSDSDSTGYRYPLPMDKLRWVFFNVLVVTFLIFRSCGSVMGVVLSVVDFVVVVHLLSLIDIGSLYNGAKWSIEVVCI